ncbi:MAG: hypothetical protein QW465_02395 [Candidatus Anstonellales archaeon]
MNIEKNIDANQIQIMVKDMIDSISDTCTDPINDRCIDEKQTLAESFEALKPQIGFFSKAIETAVDKIFGNLYRLGAGTKIFDDKYCPTVQNLGFVTNYFSLAVILLLSYLFIEFIARILNNTKYTALARREIMEIIIIIPLLIALLNLPCFISINDNTPLHTKSLLYIHSAIVSSMISLIPLSYYAATVGAHAVMIVQNLGGGAPQTLPLSYQYYESSLSLSKQVASFLTLSFIWIGTFAFMYDIFTYGFVKYLLPLALLLRFIPFTRNLGGGLIGLIIATNLFIPIILSINYEIIKIFGAGYFYYNNGNVTFKFNPWLEMAIHIFGAFLILMSSLYILTGFRLFIDIRNVIRRFRIWQATREGMRRMLASLIGAAGGAAATTLDLFLAMRVLSTSSLRVFAFQIPLLIIIAVIIVSAIIFNLLLPTVSLLFLTSTIKYMSAIFGDEFDLANLTRLI